MGSFKIKSKFYIIIGDSKPIYVGYTNRTVGQRFKEHLRDKDFSDYKSIKVIDLIQYEKSFDFTWDYSTIQKDAEIVDSTERYLISKYNTQNSIYQKEKNGGQNWNDIKYFVSSNRSNPKFKGMTGNEIKKYIINRQECTRSLINFISSIGASEEVFLHNFIINMVLPEKSSLHIFVKDMVKPENESLSYFISGMRLLKESCLHSFVSGMVIIEKTFLMSFVNNMKERKIKND